MGDVLVSKWWLRRVDGRRAPANPAEPQCGYYKRRAVKGGPWAAVQIWFIEGAGEFRCYEGGDPKNHPHGGGRYRHVEEIWPVVTPITMAAWAELAAVNERDGWRKPVNLAATGMGPNQ